MKLDLQLAETHKRTVTVRISWKDLKVYFAEEVARQAGMSKPHIEGHINRRGSSVVAKVDYHEEKEGSPSYTTGFAISVTLTQDMEPIAHAAPTED